MTIIMDKLAIVEGEKARLISELDKLFGNFNLIELPSITEAIEEFLRLHVKNVIVRHSDLLCGCSSCEISSWVVRKNNESYAVATSEDVTNPKIVHLSLSPRAPGIKKKFRQKTITISGYGRYEKIRFFLPRSLSIDDSLLEELIGTIYEAGYFWATRQIELFLAREEICLADDLYEYLKKIIHSPELQKNLWVACITSSYGFRLIEKDVASNAFQLIDKHSASYGHSTNRLVAELVSTRLPKEGLLMNIAAQINQCMDGDMSQAKYKKEGSIYASTMAALYGSESFTIFPIQVSEPLSVFALFPTEHRNIIRPILSQHKVYLSKIIEISLPNIKQAEKIFDRCLKKNLLLKLINEVVMLKPNFFGLGIDLNEFFKKISTELKELLRINRRSNRH